MSAIIVVGLGYGDEGKGTTVDFLTKTHESTLNVRFNGGAQAAHTVILPDGREHIFSQWGSGTFHGAKTLLSHYVLIDPTALETEAKNLQANGIINPFQLMFIDSNAKVVSPFHKAVNRIRELERGTGLHGSCGMGIGEAMQDSLESPLNSIKVKDCFNKVLLSKKLRNQWKAKRHLGELGTTNYHQFILNGDEYIEDIVTQFMETLSKVSIIRDTEFLKQYLSNDNVIFEGAQGVLLDEWFGFFPHTTWSTTYSKNAIQLIHETGKSDYDVIGVIRSYSTRHGAGYLASENEFKESVNEIHNKHNDWQGAFRNGYFNLPLLKYALKVDPCVKQIMLTHVDTFNKFENPYYIEEYIGLTDISPYDLAYSEQLLKAQEHLGAKLQNAAIKLSPLNNWGHLIDVINQSCKVKFISYGQTHLSKEKL